jgi:hypothetical protein
MAPESRKRTRLALLVDQRGIFDWLARQEDVGLLCRGDGASIGACPVRVSDDRWRSGRDDKRCRHQVAGFLAGQQPASFTVNGIVMAGMKPLMSSCRMSTSLRAGSMPRICP